MDHDLRLSPFNFKAMVKELATQMASHAKDVGVMLLLAQDQRIPELFLGDKARLKPLVSCFILNGINLCKHPGGTCTVMSTTIESESPDKFGIRFAVKDDGDGLTTEEYKDLYNPARSSKNSAFISLYPFQKIISAHGGVIDVQTAPGKGSTFSFEIYFRVPQEAGITVELLNKAHLEGKVLKESIPLKHGVNPAAQHLTMERFNKSIAERLKVGGEAEERKSPKASSSSSVYSLPSHNPPSPSPPSPPRIPASSLSAQQTTPTERLTPVQFGAEIHTPIVHNLPSSAATSRSSIKTIEGPVREITSGDATQVLLVVDDVLSNRMMTGKVLQLMGFMVEFAEDGKQAVDMCTSRLRDVSKPYGVIMMDNMMPIMTGKEATMTLRSMNYNGTIVGLTGNVLDEDLEEFRESGCDEVITKPLDIAELKRTLSSLGIVIPKKQS